MFIASPIQDMDTDDAFEILGVMVFKIDLEQINNIMSSDSAWETIGMGKTGDAYLVGGDKTLRSNARLLIEDKDRYLQKLSATGSEQSTIDTIKLQSTSVAPRLLVISS